ncbi:MAG: NYN domain-containing protein [bacterium]|nr:NYN domain-containing protein [bacterium]
MEYIIDGFNLIKTSFIKKYERQGIEFAQEFLIDILERYKRKHPTIDITIVFDGKSSNFSFYQRRKIKIIFSNETSADEKIREILENRKERKQIWVVSDDREVQEFTKILGSKFINVNEFLEVVYPLEKKEKIPLNINKNIKYRARLEIEKELKNFYGKKIRENSK